MTARKNQSQSIVGDLFAGTRRIRTRDIFESDRNFLLHEIESTASTKCINRLKSSCGDEPCARIGRHAIQCPLLDSRGKRIMHGFFSQIEIA